jgi:cytochrome c551/c552
MPTRTTCLPARTPAGAGLPAVVSTFETTRHRRPSAAAARTSVLICVGTFLFAAADLAAQTLAPKLSGQALVDKYCAGCHNDKRTSGGFSWTTIDLADPGRSADKAEKVVRRLRSGLMPPAGAPRPDAASATALAAALETSIDRAAAAHPFAGAPELHRLNRTEYRNSVRDLLDLDVDVSAMLPADEMGRGFDNMADALAVTPTLVQGYVRAASKISREAVGDPHVAPTTTMYTVPKVVNQMRHIDGAPLGTRGGTSVVHNFPATGDYTFKLTFYYDYLETLYGQSLPSNLQGQQIDVSVDGARATIFTIDPNIPETKNILTTPRVRITAGPHRVSAAFIAKFDGPTEDQFRQVERSMVDISAGVPGFVALPHLQSMTVAGPFVVGGITGTPSRRKIFTCTPASTRDEADCAQHIIAALARQAFRRPPTDADSEFLFNYYKEGWKDGGFEGGIRMAVQAVLANPKFLFRFERTPSAAPAGANYRLDDLDVASRLSYFLWSSGPDDQLLTLASQGRLKDPATLDGEVRRMLADPRSAALVDNFAAQWLRLQNLKEVDPDGGLFPEFSRNVAQSMTRETKLLVNSIMREDRRVTDLLTADYTFVDEVLAKHYGIPGIQGSAFRRVPVTDPNRIGLLGHGSILTLTSLANRTSPVLRGKYVMEVLLGVAPPAPPANVPPLMENAENEKPLPVRERLAAHRKNPACAGCHRMMDPIGLALENFNAIGLWRAHDSGAPVDPTGQLYDGTRLDGPVSLRNAILNRADSFIGGFTENLLAYGLGRLIDYRDMPAVRSVEREAAGSDYRFSAFILAIVKSVPFQMRKADDAIMTVRKTTGTKAAGSTAK